MPPFALYCRRIEEILADRYGLIIVTRDIPDPLTGDLDGAEIHVDYALSPEDRLFLLAHLFGHTVQWNVDPHAFSLGQLRPPPVDEADLPPILAYEQEAAGYAYSLLSDAGMEDLGQWFADYTAADLAYLTHFYRTGEKRPFAQFRQTGAPLVEPRPIPEFRPARRNLRLDGLVI